MKKSDLMGSVLRPWIEGKPEECKMENLSDILTDIQAAKLIAHTHPLYQQEDEEPHDFVLRIVRAYDHAKEPGFLSNAKLSREA